MIAWLYPSRHDGNPILIQCICALSKAGHPVTILDRSRRRVLSKECNYKHIPIGWLIPRIFKLPFLIEMFLRCLLLKPKLILTSDPDVGWVGKMISALLRVPFVYYPYELYGEEYSRPKNLTTKFWMGAERLLLRIGVDLLITQNEERAAVYVSERNAHSQPVIVRNYKPKTDQPDAGQLRQRINIPDHKQIVLYQGALRPGRSLEQLIQATPLIDEKAVLVLLGYETAYVKNSLKPLIASMKQTDQERIILVPGVESSELPGLVADADVGIVLYENTGRNNLYCAPGKLSDYISVSVPVALPPFPPIRRLMAMYEFGACFEISTPASIAEAINLILAKPKSEWHSKMKPAQIDLVWETQEPIFLAAVTGLMH